MTLPTVSSDKQNQFTPPTNPSTGAVSRRTSSARSGKTKRTSELRPVTGFLGRLRSIIQWALEVIMSPYRWLFPQDLFWAHQRAPLNKAMTTAVMLSRRGSGVASGVAGSGRGDFVEHSPSWSRAELFGQSALRPGERRLSFKLAQLLAMASEPSSGSYCLRNRLITLADISSLPATAFPVAMSSSRRKHSASVSPFLLPATPPPVTLVLDLDETLVYTTSESSGTCDLIAEVSQPERPRAPPLLYYVHKRPYLDRFLSVAREWYQLAVYTASRAEYAGIVCDWLDPKGTIFEGRRWYRDSCVERDGLWLKDLQLIEPDLSKVCLIDNSPCSFLLCPDNAIPIAGWTHGQDRALMQLLPLLDALRFSKDVRSVLSLRRVM